METAINILILLVTAVFMEFVAWATHKYAMHGFLWVLHEDHHRTSGRRLQKNDLFAVFFGSLSAAAIIIGLERGLGPLASVGFGVALYGIGYFSFHDIMFHGRIKALRYRPRSGYLKRIINAHRVHHRNTGKEGATSFGFLYAPRAYDKR